MVGRIRLGPPGTPLLGGNIGRVENPSAFATQSRVCGHGGPGRTRPTIGGDPARRGFRPTVFC